MNLIYQALAISVISSIILIPINNLPIVTLAKAYSFSTASSLLAHKEISDDLAKQLQEIIDRNRQEAGEIGKGGVPGSVLAIKSPKKGKWIGASGVSNIQSQQPIDINAQFRIGSSTKTYTAVVILQLKDEGKLSLEDKLDKWLSAEIVDKITDARNITIRQLLSHTSGIYDYASDESFRSAITQNPSKEWKPEELVAFAYEKPSFANPGIGSDLCFKEARWCYSNTNFVLLGMIVEKVTGSTLKSEIENRIIRRLRLNNTFFESQTDKVPGGIVSAYWDINPKDGMDDDLTALNMSFAWATGNMVANATDLQKFAEALFTGKLLKGDTLKEMLTPYEPLLTATKGEISYGLGVWYDKLSWGEAWRISGNGTGTTAATWFFPEKRLTFVSLANQDNGGKYTFTLRDAVLKAVLGEKVSLANIFNKSNSSKSFRKANGLIK
jgi:D-alanyl-D-alanine carboxypeptidase